MAVNGSYLAFQLRVGALPFFRVYKDSILKDTLAGFVNIEQRADEVAAAAFKRMGARPATHTFDGDASQDAETAHEEGQQYYETMCGLRQATINLLTAGLFHLLEQKLAKLCYDRTFRDYRLKEANIDLIVKWYLQNFDLDLKRLPQWSWIEELRLLANAVKHAAGSGEKGIRKLRPEVFRNPLLDKMGLKWSLSDDPLRLPLAGDDLFVTEAMFLDYATSALDFVRAIIAHFQENASKNYPCSG